jgi:hypothetical protein
MTRSVGYIVCVCTQRVRVQYARINRVRMLHETNYRQRFIYRHCVLNSHVYSKRPNGFSPNMLGTYYYSPSVLRTTYFSCSRTVSARACVLSARVCVHSLIFGRIISKFAGSILRLTISGKDYVLFVFTHRVYACKRASASAYVIAHSLIYGRILFKSAVNILQVTSSSMGNVLFMFTHRTHACERARVCGRARG